MMMMSDTSAAYVKRLDVAVEFLNVLIVLASQLVLLQAKHNYTLQTRHDNIIRSASVEIQDVVCIINIIANTKKFKQCCYPPAISIYK